jgi:hypothetical protein
VAWRGGWVAGVQDVMPGVGLQRRAPLRAAGEASHTNGFSEGVGKVAATQLDLRQFIDIRRARIPFSETFSAFLFFFFFLLYL